MIPLFVFLGVSGYAHVKRELWNPGHTGIVAAGIVVVITTILGAITGGSQSFIPAVLGMAVFILSTALAVEPTGAGPIVGQTRQRALSDTSRQANSSDVEEELETIKATTGRGDEHSTRNQSNSTDIQTEMREMRKDEQQRQDQDQKQTTRERESQRPDEVVQDDELQNSDNSSDTDNKGSESDMIEDDTNHDDDEQSSGESLFKDDDIEQQGGVLEETESTFNWEQAPDVSFDDIGGYQKVKSELQEEIIDPLSSDDGRYERFNVEPSRGLLLYGPPGTGKTLFSRALASELGRPFVELSQEDLTHEHINKGPQIVGDLFTQAQHYGGVVFIDEAEQLLGERGGQNQHNEDNKITTTFLNKLSQDDQKFVVILTTNRRDQMDDAVLRPGRVDTEFEIGLPDEDARKEIIDIGLSKCPDTITTSQRKELAEVTEDWSGADIHTMMNRARMHAASENAEQLDREHVVKAFKRLSSDINN
jgi:ATP-dependent 26S proteasome regulatory subunit